MKSQSLAVDSLISEQAPASAAAVKVQLHRARVMARAWSGTISEPLRVAQASAFAGRALEALAAVAAPGSIPRIQYGVSSAALDRTAARLAESIGRDAATLPLIDALHVVTSLYPILLPVNVRGSLGAFYTPPALTERLLDQATEQGFDWRTARVLDPAAGGGAFLLRAASRMKTALGACEPAFALQQIATRLVGFELDPNAADLAQRAMEILLADLASASGRSVPCFVRLCDALEEEPDEGFDLVVGNPPYGRVALTPEQRRRYARSLYGHANLYGVFTDVALRWTKPGGLIAYLTPTSFLAGQYFSALRRLMAEEAPPVAIDFIHARRDVFEDVLQETLLAVYRKGAAAGRAQVHYLHASSDQDAKVTRNGTIGLPGNPASPWLAPRDPAHGALIRQVEAMTARFSDWGYSVSTGPLVWNRFKAQLRQKPDGRAVHPLIWAEAVTADGRFAFPARKRNHPPYFKLEDRDDWLLVRRPCVLLQRTTAKEQARRLIAAELPAAFVEKHGGVVVENHLNMIRVDASSAIPTAVVTAILNSEVVDQVFRCMSGSVAVSAFELEALPLPDRSELGHLCELVVKQRDRSRIEAECRRLYGGKL